MSYELNKRYLDFGPPTMLVLMGDMRNVASLILENLFPGDGEKESRKNTLHEWTSR